MATCKDSATGAKIRFFVGLGAIISLLYYSVLRQQQMASYELAILLVFTLAALGFDYLKVNQFLAVLNTQKEAQCSHEVSIRTALTTTLKSRILLRLVGTELLALYYAFLAKSESHSVVGENRWFSYSRSSNAHDVFLFVALSQLPFLPFIHIILEYKKGPGLAWAVTLITLWSVIWYLAQVEAVKLRPIELAKDRLKYRFGIIWTADIPLKRISTARSIDAGEQLDERDMFLSPWGSTRNILLEFDIPIQFTGPYSLRVRKRKAAISVDNPSHFLSHLALRGIATS